MEKEIYTGLTKDEKENVLKAYLEEHEDVERIIYFRPKFMPEMAHIPGINVSIESYTWEEVILYKTFYPLLDKLDSSCLIIMDEMMRTQKRNDLTYNCLHHYVNQTSHAIAFEMFPMISEPQDFMILIDMVYPYSVKGQPFDTKYLEKEFVHIKPVEITLDEHSVMVPDDILPEYEAEKEALFEEAEDTSKDPDSIPRNLHVWVGTKIKKPYVQDGYVARNKRFKTCETYKSQVAGYEKTLVDFPTKQIYFNDFIKATGARKLHFLTTGLSVDNMYFAQYKGWIQMLQEVFYNA